MRKRFKKKTSINKESSIGGADTNMGTKRGTNFSAPSNYLELDPKNPIPFETSGAGIAFTGVLNKSSGYLPFLDDQDNFFEVLLEAKLLSPTNNACVNSKTLFSIGSGLSVLNNSEEKSSFLTWSKRVNNKNESLNSVLKNIFMHHYTVGNNFIEIIRGEVGSERFVRVINRSFLDCRLSLPNEYDICESVILSRNFRKKGFLSFDKNKSSVLPIYRGEDTKWLKNKGTEHCIIHIKNSFSGYDYYGIPDNIACLEQQVLEHKITRNNIDKIDNGLAIGGVIVLDANMTQEEADVLSGKINRIHKGEGNIGKWAFVSNKNPEKTSIIPYNIQQEGSFIKIDERIEQKIIDANNWDRSIYGQHKTGGLGNGGATFMSSIFEVKSKTIIEPVRRHILEEFLEPLLEICDNWMGTNWRNLDIDFKNNTPMTFMGDIDINSILEINEARKLLGLSEIPEGNKSIK